MLPITTRLAVIAVTLDPVDLAYGWDLGKWRSITSIRNGDRDKRGAAHGADGLTIHLQGALAEVAVARFLRRPLPTGIGVFHTEPDLPPDVEVRWRSRDDWDLIVRDDDSPDYRFVLVTGHAPTFHLQGWTWGRDARRDEWIRNYGGHGPAWFVPASALQPLGS